MSFGLRLKKYPKAEIKSVSMKPRACSISQSWIDRKPKQLSGGTAPARLPWAAPSCAIPRCSCLTSVVQLGRQAARADALEIKKVHQKVRTTTVYVTHDQVEAMTLADRVVVMNHGRIELIGTPNELYHHRRRALSRVSLVRLR